MFAAIDAAGKHDSINISAQRRMRDPDSLAMTEYKPAWTLRVENLQSTIRLVAEETGGSVLANTRAYDSFFDDLRDRLDNYYSLGYAAPHPKEGGAHKIVVRVKQPGLRVHHRRAYRDKTWTDRLTDRLVAELLLGVGDNPLEVIAGTVFNDPGATATDNVDAVVGVTVTGVVDTGTPGRFVDVTLVWKKRAPRPVQGALDLAAYLWPPDIAMASE